MSRRTKDPLPEFIDPMLATLWPAGFDDPDWLYEIKWDGFRVETVVDGDRVMMWTRGRQDAARYFGSFIAPPTWLAATTAILDGEVVALDRDGEPDFALLQADLREAEGGQLVYQVFDLLYADGESLLERPLEDRKARLANILRPDPRVRYSDHVVGEGLAFLEEARRRRLEGVMAKHRQAPYLPGKRSDRWRKLKIRPEQELVVGGFARGLGSAVDLGALSVGVYEDGRLRYAGKVGAGFNNTTRRAELLELLEPLARETTPFDPPPPRRLANGVIWVEPKVVIRAELAGWTSNGIVRQASYKGLDIGKDAAKVVREVPGKR
jgi:bifunctional non-homologous end joining protein LigD